jgi:shikimate kinase
LLAQREPVYALADLTVISQDEPHDVVVDAVIAALGAHLPTAPAGVSV